MTQNASRWLPLLFIVIVFFLQAEANVCFVRVRQAAMEGVAVLGQLLGREG